MWFGILLIKNAKRNKDPPQVSMVESLCCVSRVRVAGVHEERIACLHLLPWTETCTSLNPSWPTDHNMILILTQNWIPIHACVYVYVYACVCNPRGCHQLLLKPEHETQAAASHKTLTLDHRACKKHVSFNLGPTWTWRWGPLTRYTRGCIVVAINMHGRCICLP